MIARALLLPLLFSLAAAGSANGQDANAAKIGRLMDESGFTFTKQSATVWAVPFEGKKLKDIAVVVYLSENMLSAYALVTEKKDLKLTPEVLQKLLRLNDEFDRVKISIDKDGDVAARIDLSVRVADLSELKAIVEQVSAAADETYDALKPALIKRK